jgi:hypothetical protein
MILLLGLYAGLAHAGSYADSLRVFKNAGTSARFFTDCYGYALFPTVGQGGAGIGVTHGKGRVYVKGEHVGDASMTQISIGLQLGGKVYTQIIFFEDERSFKDFTSGNFELSAQAQAIAITASASASASTAGNSAGASGGKNNASTLGGYYKGMAIFTVAKGGFMYEASVAGQKFNYRPRKPPSKPKSLEKQTRLTPPEWVRMSS